MKLYPHKNHEVFLKYNYEDDVDMRKWEKGK